MNAPYIHYGISLTAVKRIALNYLIDVRPKPADTTASQSPSSCSARYENLSKRKMDALGRLDEELKRAALIRSLTDYLLSHANNRV